MNNFLRSVLVLGLLGTSSISTQAIAQNDALPQMPEPIQNLVNEGAQYRYLGKDNGMDAWLTVKNGVEQFFYVQPDRKSFIMGVMFDESGKAVTFEQVRRLREKGDDLLDSLTDLPEPNVDTSKNNFELNTPAEQMFADVTGTNWVPLGNPSAPVLYSFIDPQCPHCHSFFDEVLKGKYIEEGKVQLRLIPVGFKDETLAQAAFLIASPNPQERWMKHMAGEKDALPAKAGINTQGVQNNLSVMQSWKFDATPMGVYRGRDGSVKIIRGKPQDLKNVIADLGTAG